MQPGFLASHLTSKSALLRGVILGSVLCLSSLGLPASADTITVQSDASTLAAGLGPGAPSPANAALLDSGDTTGLTFSLVDPGAEGTFTSVPPGAPAGTLVVNIALPTLGEGESGFFKTTFTLPSVFSGISLAGAANVDDFGRIFLNGHPISPSPTSGDPNIITEFGNAAFSTSDSSFFQSGENVLLVADDNAGGGPSGAAYFATISFSTASVVPEPGVFALPAGIGTLGALLILRRRKR